MSDNKVAIAEVVKLYFDGAHQGDAEQLRRAFHPEARIIGNFKGQSCDWTLSDFIKRVSESPAASRDEEFNKEIIFIDCTDDLAIVKTKIVAGGNNFTDYLTLLKMDGNWMIRNKGFTTSEALK